MLPVFGVPPRLLRPGVDQLRPDPQLPAEGLQEGEPLLEAVQEGDLQVGAQQLHGHRREPRPGAHVDEPGPLGQLRHGEGQDAVGEMLHRDPLVVGDGGEVHPLVPVLEHPAVNRKFLIVPLHPHGVEHLIKLRFCNHNLLLVSTLRFILIFVPLAALVRGCHFLGQKKVAKDCRCASLSFE